MSNTLLRIAISAALGATIAACASSGTPSSSSSSASGTEAAVANASAAACQLWDGVSPVTIDVSSSFAEGQQLRDFYSQQLVTVADGKVTLVPAEQSQGLVLLEAESHTPDAFSWDSASVYFVITDRFYNGNPDNDNSYGRSKDGKNEIGTFHGGDIAGLTAQLDYLGELGIDAIWITAPYEQIRGWVGGGMRGDFKHYGYHGYYVQDYTLMDQNMGTEDELRQFVDSAHARGIRVVMDIVMNHTGYATLADMQQFGFGATQEYDGGIEQYLGENWSDWSPGKGETWHSFNDYIDYGDREAWQRWWGKDWVRTDISGYPAPGPSDLTMSLAYLPDFKTESLDAVGLPNFYQNKPDTKAVEIPGATVRDYLITWLSDWVREYGIDGFRADTVKHVEPEAWLELKLAASRAFEDWKQANPDKVLDDNPFWMTGEFWGQGINHSPLYAKGFDSLINFSFQEDDASKGVGCLAEMQSTYQRYADVLGGREEQVLSYISSHDTKLAYGSISKTPEQHQQLGTAFALLPGAIQVFYGDESARSKGPRSSDRHQATRSPMNWDELEGEKAEVLSHWQTVLNFRRRHNAVATGTHKQLSTSPYVFERSTDDSKVVVAYFGMQ
ncbi:alpha-amylase [Aliagarivorans marinus]|uniref:alpha-amylase n=1 Tax=Aliagarivorans marinus TaxID=561965 RepID=UPI00041BFA3A|nr:alpha-amylase [Aliagarivorans marinus]